MGLTETVQEHHRHLDGKPNGRHILRSRVELLADEASMAASSVGYIIGEYFRKTLPPEYRNEPIITNGKEKLVLIVHGWAENRGPHGYLDESLSSDGSRIIRRINVDFFDSTRETIEGRFDWRVKGLQNQVRKGFYVFSVGELFGKVDGSSRDKEYPDTVLKVIADLQNGDLFSEMPGALSQIRYLGRKRIPKQIEELASEAMKMVVKVDIIGFSYGGVIGFDYTLRPGNQDVVDHCMMLGAPIWDGTLVAYAAYPLMVFDFLRYIGVLRQTDHIGKSGRRGYDIGASSARDMVPGSQLIKENKIDYLRRLEDGTLKTKYYNIGTGGDEALLFNIPKIPGMVNFDFHKAGLTVGHLGLTRHPEAVRIINLMLSHASNGNYHRLVDKSERDMLSTLETMERANGYRNGVMPGHMRRT